MRKRLKGKMPHIKTIVPLWAALDSELSPRKPSYLFDLKGID
jgi:hypothetical protein